MFEYCILWPFHELLTYPFIATRPPHLVLSTHNHPQQSKHTFQHEWNAQRKKKKTPSTPSCVRVLSPLCCIKRMVTIVSRWSWKLAQTQVRRFFLFSFLFFSPPSVRSIKDGGRKVLRCGQRVANTSDALAMAVRGQEMNIWRAKRGYLTPGNVKGCQTGRPLRGLALYNAAPVANWRWLCRRRAVAISFSGFCNARSLKNIEISRQSRLKFHVFGQIGGPTFVQMVKGEEGKWTRKSRRWKDWKVWGFRS